MPKKQNPPPRFQRENVMGRIMGLWSWWPWALGHLVLVLVLGFWMFVRDHTPLACVAVPRPAWPFCYLHEFLKVILYMLLLIAVLIDFCAKLGAT